MRYLANCRSLLQQVRRPDPHVDGSAALIVATITLIWTVGVVTSFETALTAIVVLGYILLFWGILRPAIGLLGIGLLCTVDSPVQVYLNRFLPWNALNYCLLLTILANLPLLARFKDAHSRILKCMAGFLAVGLLWSGDLEGGEQHLLNMSTQFGILVYFLRVTRNGRAWVWLGITAGSVAAGGAAVYYLKAGELTYINPNAWAQFPLTGLLATCIAWPMAVSKRFGIGALQLLAFVNFVWIFLSGSRGVLFTGTSCLLFLLLKRPAHHRGLVLAGLAIAVAAGLLSLFPDLGERTVGRIQILINPNNSANARTSSRYDLMVAGWRIFLDHPLGVGTGGFPKEYAATSGGMAHAGHERQAHSGWVKVLVENGALGLALLLAYVVSFAVAGWKMRSQGQLAIAILTTAALAIAFVSTEFQNKGLWLLTAGVTVLMHSPSFAARPQRRPCPRRESVPGQLAYANRV
jgi:hypothetical protein